MHAVPAGARLDAVAEGAVAVARVDPQHSVVVDGREVQLARAGEVAGGQLAHRVPAGAGLDAVAEPATAGTRVVEQLAAGRFDRDHIGLAVTAEVAAREVGHADVLRSRLGLHDLGVAVGAVAVVVDVTAGVIGRVDAGGGARTGLFPDLRRGAARVGPATEEHDVGVYVVEHVAGLQIVQAGQPGGDLRQRPGGEAGVQVPGHRDEPGAVLAVIAALRVRVVVRLAVRNGAVDPVLGTGHDLCGGDLAPHGGGAGRMCRGSGRSGDAQTGDRGGDQGGDGGLLQLGCERRHDGSPEI